MKKVWLWIALLGTQAACLQAVTLPAHRLAGGEIVASGAVEASASPRLSGSATFGIADGGDISIYGGAGGFLGNVLENPFVSGGLGARVYLPASWALGATFEFTQGFGEPLADGGELAQVFQGMVSLVSQPDEDFWLFGGPTVTLPFGIPGQQENQPDFLAIFGGVLGLYIPVSEAARIQVSLHMRPLVLSRGEDGVRFGGFVEENIGSNFLVLQANLGIHLSFGP